MFAVIQTGGKQYRVSEGDILRLELLENKGAVEFNQVLMIGDGAKVQIGTPLVKGAKVMGEVIRDGKAKKVLVYKKKRTTTYQRTKGHRQSFSEVRIKSIQS
ncbi:MAG: 50S ribosomal protein L21 [Holophagaceae bacterium]|jgi:large subunit ribosomal protein L21|nr:50S ribosomal protein L21 [Acidobacteriota bacterium]